MALNKKRDAVLEELILRGAAEIRRLNPHIGQPQGEMTDAEYAEIEEIEGELERLWNSPEGQQAQALGYSAADAIIEDRGE